MMTISSFVKNLYILEDSASGVQVGDMEQAIQTFYSPLARWASPIFWGLDLAIPRLAFFFKYHF